MTTYYIDTALTIGTGYGTGSVSGTITDVAANSSNGWWDLTVTIGTRSFEFTPLTSGKIIGNSSLIANDDTLTFDDARYFYFSGGAGTGYLVGWQSGCQDSYCGNNGVFLGQLGYDIHGTDWYPIQAYTTDPVIGHAIAPVPAPVAGSGLLGVLVLVASLMRLRQTGSRT